MLAETARWPVASIATGTEMSSVQRFRAKLLANHIVSYFSSAAELEELSIAAFMRLAAGAPGQVDEVAVPPKSEGSGQDAVASALLEIRSQLAFLTSRILDQSRSPHDQGAQRFASAVFLGPATPQIDRTQVFVIMPYSMPWSKGVELLISDACKAAGFQSEVAKYSDGRMIIQDIWKTLTGSAAVIADITGANPNVAYEIGLADALGREVILMTQHIDVPVDFRAARLLTYDNTIDGSQVLREELQNRLMTLRQKLEEN